MGLKIDHQQPQNNRQKKSSSIDNLLKMEITVLGNRFGPKQKEQFYAELSVLLGSGIRLKDALNLLATTQKKKNLSILFENMEKGILAGTDFSKLLESNTDFTNYETHSIRIGEQSGTLTSVMQALAEFYACKNEQRQQLINALTYPIIVLVTAILAVVFMMRFVVPMFKDVFRQNDVDLPGITRTVLTISEWIGQYGWTILVFLIGLLILRPFFNRSHRYRSLRDRIFLKLPMIGGFVRTANLARFTQAVSLLVNSKVSIPQSIKLAKGMIDFVPLQDALDQVQHSILQGNSLSESLRQQSIFDLKMVALVKVAEETNATEYIFDRLNMQYNKAVLQQSKMFSTVLEPVIILLVGVIVGAILVAMYLPMFELGNVLK